MAENMVKAGRAGLTFGGDWDSTVEYNRLVGVRYNNNLFFSKKTVPAGTIPEDGEFWFLAIEGLTDAEKEGLLNGTIQVGDSAKLGGKLPSEYAEKTELYNHAIPIYTVTTEEAMTEAYDGSHTNNEDATFYKAEIFHRVSHPILGSGTWYLEGFRINANYGWQSAKQYDATTTKVYYRSINNGAFGEWKRDAIGDFLPLSGGTVKGTGIAPIIVDNTSANAGSFVAFCKNNETNGYLGFNGLRKPVYREPAGALHDILHTGNKPSGTYTGNGDATQRTIAVGHGTNFIIRSVDGTNRTIAIVTTNGYIGAVIGGAFDNGTSAYSGGGNIVLRSANELFNASGVTYEYFTL